MQRPKTPTGMRLADRGAAADVQGSPHLTKILGLRMWSRPQVIPVSWDTKSNITKMFLVTWPGLSPERGRGLKNKLQVRRRRHTAWQHKSRERSLRYWRFSSLRKGKKYMLKSSYPNCTGPTKLELLSMIRRALQIFFSTRNTKFSSLPGRITTRP